MPLRLIDTVIPKDEATYVDEEPDHVEILDQWRLSIDGGKLLIRLLVQAEDADATVEHMSQAYSHVRGFRVLVSALEATLPQPEIEKPEESPDDSAADEASPPVKKNGFLQVSREALQSELESASRFSRIFLLMVILSTVVAAVGLLRDSVAIIIGAMVIAPLLGPNMGLALATTLGDGPLAKRSIFSLVIGIATALALSIVMGLCLTFDPNLPEIISRTKVSFGDIALAIASGCAGTLAFTSGASSSLIGVMVAVALLPPLVVVGLHLGAGISDPAMFKPAMGAMLLLMTNLICVNLAGVVTFLAQGVHPRKWWEADKAKRMTVKMILVWSILLSILAILIYLSQQQG